MNKLFFFSLLILFIKLSSFSQTACDTLQRLKLESKKIELLYKKEISLKEKTKLYAKYELTNRKSIEPAKRCMLTNKSKTGSLEELKDNYTLGKLYYQSGYCKEAQILFAKCLANTNSSKAITPTASYAQVIGQVFQKCLASKQSDGGVINGFAVEYSGKGSAFVKNLFLSVSDSLFYDLPLNSNELEHIYKNRITASQVIDSALALQLSGSKNYNYKSPFLFLQGSESFFQNSIRQEKNIASSDPYTETLKLNDYSYFMFKQYLVLKKAYFNVFNPDSNRIAVHLYGGRYDKYGLTNYLQYCQKLHLRAHKRVAYFMPIDNSIVAWVNTGGGTLIHEMVHALLENEYKHAPQWINEGMASLYEEVSDGDPINNYRLIYIQRLMLENKVCIKWTDLANIENYTEINETNYNLFCAYSRYFCKFIYDTYGQKTLSDLYKTMRDANITDATQQKTQIVTSLNKSEANIQLEWQNYLMTQKIPKKWKKMMPEIENEISKNKLIVFEKSKLVSDKTNTLWLKLTENYTNSQNGTESSGNPNDGSLQQIQGGVIDPTK